MIHFLCKTTLVRASSPISKQGFLRNPLMLLSLRYTSISSSQHSFTVSYLINSLGLSPDSALSASKYVNFETQEKPDLVVEFFKSHGFSKSQISNLVRRLPSVLLSNPEKTLLPKLLFFQSKGLSSPEIAKMMSGCPIVLKRSLEKQIIPAYDLFCDLLQSEERTVTSIKRFVGILTYDLEAYAGPNIAILRENGVPGSNIITILQYQPRIFFINSDRFKEVVEKVKEMGFNPLRLKFVLAVFAFRAMRKSTWERKVDAYKSWGLSEKEILEAFGRHPWCMMASEDKINAVMDFFVNKMGWDASHIVKRPGLVSLSFERRIVPRGLLIQEMTSRGLLKKDLNLPAFFESPEKLFLEKFVLPYKKEASELMKLYEEKLVLSKCKR